jgi:hypothetical protein
VGEGWTKPKPVEGVTTILSIINKQALVPWASKTAAYYFRDTVKAALAAGESPNLNAIAEDAKKAHNAVSTKGKRAGTVGHAIAEALLLNKTVTMPTDPELRAQAESVQRAFMGFMDYFKPETIAVEEAFYSLRYGYAGKFDYLAKINGKVVLIDFKTTNPSYFNPNGIYAEYFAQLGAYEIGYSEMTGAKIDEVMIINLPKDGTEFKALSNTDIGLTMIDCQNYWLAALWLHEQHQKFERKSKQ